MSNKKYNLNDMVITTWGFRGRIIKIFLHEGITIYTVKQDKITHSVSAELLM